MADLFDLYYGEPGSGKSRSLIELIKATHQETGKKARVYLGDGSKLMYINSGLIKSGIVQAMDFSVRNYPFTTLQQITEGYWPEDIENAASKMRMLTPQEVQETGLWIFEGASVAGVYMMGHMKGALAYRAGQGEVIGQEANIQFQDDPDHKFGGNPGAHYNVAQRHLHADILRSKAFPGTVIWTAHERVDDGERGGAFAKGQAATEKTRVSEKIIGPELVGKALTANISRDFNNTLHFTKASKKVQQGNDTTTGKSNYVEATEFRVYTADHYDPDGIVGLKYRAVSRAINPKGIKLYYAAEDPGMALMNFYADLRKGN